ncbi:hypothetical protein [Actinoplanes teichomyceticus]|uniref:Uncharacterized protein n=1 Tax=Actinoplanes teichomyceticus TaxID=1867 RepID=A0A561WAR5_ACTTI|nr:hypothetical protein [Actinoplanes teichomyceticus]TWG20957.1 hypothetical protein FHX34_103486 [Actinoplanes teichomyceticus]GIF16543.1 hypothetical protein Ate01nite_65750 [Actinoplanes teichomyceticus]
MLTNTSKLAEAINRDRPPQGAPSAWMEPAIVTAVALGAAAESNALVTVSWRGTAVQAAYLSSYSPAVNDVVLVLIQPPGGLTVLGRIIGTPPS